MRIEDDNIVRQLEDIADALSDIDTSRIPNLFEYISEQEFDKILEVSELLYDLAHEMNDDEYIEDIDTTSRYDYYTDEYGGVAFESYDKKDHIEYNGYDISYMPDYVDGYTVQYDGDDIVFDTIDEAKAFIDGLK